MIKHIQKLILIILQLHIQLDEIKTHREYYPDHQTQRDITLYVVAQCTVLHDKVAHFWLDASALYRVKIQNRTQFEVNPLYVP